MTGLDLFNPHAFVRSEAPEVAEMSLDQHMPAPWRAGMVKLMEMHAPSGMPADRWAQIVADATRLALSRCGHDVAAQGWSIIDVFGVDPADTGFYGLVGAIRGDQVVNVTTEHAGMLTGNGHRWHYRGHISPDSVPLWLFRGLA